MRFDLELDGAGRIRSQLENIKRKGNDDTVYIVGSNVEYGVFLEFGTEDMPPYPWFRPAIRELKANPESFILSNTDFSSIDDIDSTDELITTVAAALENQMTNNVNAQKSVDRSPGTHPEHPQRDTGNLTASIQAVRVR